MVEIVWQDVPAPMTGKTNRGLKRSPWWDVLYKLDERPGEWALIEPSYKGTIHPLYGLVKQQRLPYEVTTRKNAQGGRSVYARRKETSEEEQIQTR